MICKEKYASIFFNSNAGLLFIISQIFFECKNWEISLRCPQFKLDIFGHVTL